MNFLSNVNRVWHRVAGFLALMILAIVPVSAQEKPGDSALTARNVFERLQAPSLELLKQTTRLDMLDYWDADSVYKAKNAMNGESWLENVTPDYLKLHITPVSTLEVKLLPGKKAPVVMTIYTIGGEGQARDSMVEFYDPDLNPVDASLYFVEPDLKTFFDIPKGSATSIKELREMIPFPTVEYSATAGSDNLTGRLTSGEYMNVDDWNIARLFLKPEIVIPWKGKYKLK